MKIAVLGAGGVGRGIGGILATAGHEVVYGVRAPKNGEMSFADAVSDAAVVLLAVPYSAAEPVIAAAGDLTGKVLIDATNAVDMGDEGPRIALKPGQSAGENIATWAEAADVYKSFNQVGVEVLAEPDSFGGAKPFMLIAGPDGESRSIAEQVVSDAGFDPQYLGSIRQSHLLEAFAMIWINLTGTGRTGRDWALVRHHMETDQ
ncbi:NADPH-dependent F420 reductase [Aestuariibius sp. 2305UL40-4]|uniref:NADPH-dependent F420 reductase n=1 Tax=Aestuariibius violaceus TaxID=3234132 RepID=UPI00345E896F